MASAGGRAGVRCHRVFGLYRFLLATCVFVSHAAPAPNIGAASVFGFYMLSGYLMARISLGAYNGRYRQYLVNRALRIYPAHIAALGLAAAVLALGGGSWWPSQTLPADAGTWIRNLLLIGTQGLPAGRLNPITWSLTVEIAFYLLIPLLARTRLRCLTWFAISLVLSVILTTAGYQAQIYSIAGASLPFAVGALIMHLDSNAWANGRVAAGAAVALGILYVFATFLSKQDFGAFALYPIVVVQAVLLWSLIRLRLSHLGDVDRILGDLTYPIFLTHAAALSLLAGTGLVTERSWTTLVLATPLTLVFAMALHRLVERPLVPIRDRIRTAPGAIAVGKRVS